MKPAPFKYFAPSTTEEALVYLGEYGYEAKVLAGGQSLIPTMNFRLAQPSVLIDLNNIPELSYIKKGPDGLRIGAMTRQRELENDPLVLENSKLIHETMPFIAHSQIRNRGTVGGSIAHADPASELPAVMLTLQANFRVRNRSEERWIPASEFFMGMFSTALSPEEILVEIAVPPLPPRSGWSFQEVARRHGDFALVGVAAVVSLNENSKCQQARMALLSVGDGPVVASRSAQSLVGHTVTEELIRAAAEVTATQDIDPPGDIHASSEYRRHLARVLTARALKQAFKRAQDKN
jgi:carbon-monoxide dehydrogenase medium subunit